MPGVLRSVGSALNLTSPCKHLGVITHFLCQTFPANTRDKEAIRRMGTRKTDYCDTLLGRTFKEELNVLLVSSEYWTTLD